MNVLIAVDCDNSSYTLIDHVLELFDEKMEKIWLLHVADSDPDFIGYDVGPDVVRDAVAEEYHEEHKLIQKMGEYIRGKGLDCTCLLVQGVISDQILQQTIRLETDILVLGYHRNSLLRHMINGNTYNKLIKDIKTSVLTIPLPKT